MGICCCLLEPQTNSYQAEACRLSMYSRQAFRYAPERPTTGKVRIARYSGAIQNESLNAHGTPPLYPGEV
jgi:hypothetical protein